LIESISGLKRLDIKTLFPKVNDSLVVQISDHCLCLRYSRMEIPAHRSGGNSIINH
jgi:hypothetical protein